MLASLTFAATAAFGDVSTDVGYISSGQGFSVSYDTNSDCYLEVINTDTNQVAAYINVYFNGYWIPYDPYYGSGGGSDLSGVTVTHSGNNEDIQGLPAGNYRFQTYTPAPSSDHYTTSTSTYETFDYVGYRYLDTVLTVY